MALVDCFFIKNGSGCRTYMARAGLATSRDSHLKGHEIWIWYSFCLAALLTFHSAVLAKTVGRKDGYRANVQLPRDPMMSKYLNLKLCETSGMMRL